MAISLGEVQALLTDLVSLNTTNPPRDPPPDSQPVERPAVDLLASLCEREGLPWRRQPAGMGHENLITWLDGEADSPALLLEGHLDVVPAEDWADRAFSPRVEDGWLCGRGACDAKASVTGMLLAMFDLAREGIRPPRPVIFLGAADEERGGGGAKQFVRTAPEVEAAVVGEPTGLIPVVAHKGGIRWEITFLGRSAHSSVPEHGVNAIREAMRAIAALEALEGHFRATTSHEMLTGPTITPTMIRGGRAHNVIPDECAVWIDVRTVPGLPEQEAKDRVIEALETMGVEARHGPVLVSTPPLDTNPQEPISQACLAACKKAGTADRFGTLTGGTDAPIFAAAGWPSIVLGPGDLHRAHAVDEKVSLEEVLKASGVYRDVILNSR